MPVPKATVNEDHLFSWSKNKVGATGQISAIQRITKTHSMNKRANHKFWLSILAAHQSHALASFGGG